MYQQRVRATSFFILCTCVFTPALSYAQKQPVVSKKTYQSGVEYDPGNSNKNTAKTPQFDASAKAKVEAQNELKQVNAHVAKNQCEVEEDQARRANAEFILKNGDVADKVGHQFLDKFKKAAKKLRDLQAGIVDGDKNAVVSIIVNNQFGEPVNETVSVKELFQFIDKMNSELKKVQTSAEIASVVAKYENADNLESDEFSCLDLERAKKAYLNLNSSFQESKDESEHFELSTSHGKDQFIVTTVFQMGGDEQGNTFGSEMADPKNSLHGFAQLRYPQNEATAFDAPSEARFWDQIREFRLSINGVPIDGVQRREYFDNMYRSAACKRDLIITVPNAPPGPNLPYGQVQRQECPPGIFMIWATVNGGGYTWPITDKVKAMYSSGQYIGQNLETMFPEDNYIRQCPDVYVNFHYRCRCEDKTFQVYIKTDQAISSYLPQCN